MYTSRQCRISVSAFAQVLGIDALHTREVKNTHSLLERHLKMVRAIPLLANTTAVLSFESNLAFESQHLLHHLHNVGFKKWMSLSEGAQQTLGWLTTHSRKEQMALLLRECLHVGKIAYSSYFFSLSMTKQEARKRMGDEIRNFSVVTEPGKTAFAKSRKTYTGKLGGMQDDCVISLQLALIAQRTFWEDPRYSQFSKQSV